MNENAEFGIRNSELAEAPKKRTLEDIAGEIRTYTAAMLFSIVEIGRRMCEAKELLPYGEFGKWITENTGYSSSKANNYMRLFREFTNPQGNLFGPELCHTYGKLSYSNALALLDVPAEEREEFVIEHDAEHLSTRELKEAIAARKAAEERAEALSRDMDELEDQVRAAEEKARRASDNENELLRKLSEAKKDVLAADEMAEKNERELRERIKELESRPIEVAVEKDEKALEEAAAAARAEAEAEAAGKISALQKKLEKAEKEKEQRADELSPYVEKLHAAEAEAERTRTQIEAMRRQLAASDKDVTEFILHSKSAQTSLQAMLDSLGAIAAREPETARKLNAGLKSLTDRIGARCAEIEAGFQKREAQG